MVMRRAGSGSGSANRITLLRDTDAMASPNRSIFLTGLNSRSAWRWWALLYVANTDALMGFPYRDGETNIAPPAVADLPGGTINHHWTKNLIAAPMARGFMSPSAPTPMRVRTAWRREGRAASRIDPASGRGAFRMRPAQSQRAFLEASERRAVGHGQ